MHNDKCLSSCVKPINMSRTFTKSGLGTEGQMGGVGPFLTYIGLMELTPDAVDMDL